jgi:hypothetical protein
MGTSDAAKVDATFNGVAVSADAEPGSRLDIKTTTSSALTRTIRA